MKKHLILLIIPLLFFSIGCEKDNDISGCTDPDATNYQNLANVNDNSCLYESDILLYWFEDWAVHAQQNFGNNASFNVWIDGVLVGAASNAIVNNYIPDCGTIALIETTVDLGYLKQKDIVIEYQFNSTIIASQTVTMFANECHKVEIEQF